MGCGAVCAGMYGVWGMGRGVHQCVRAPPSLCDMPVCVTAQIASQLEAAANGRERGGLESRLAKARVKLEAARDKVESVERAPLPKVEVRR